MNKWEDRLRSVRDLNTPQDHLNGLTPLELDLLTLYTTEKARGLVHTLEWQAKMEALQNKFDNPILTTDRKSKPKWTEFSDGGD